MTLLVGKTRIILTGHITSNRGTSKFKKRKEKKTNLGIHKLYKVYVGGVSVYAVKSFGKKISEK